MLKNELNKLLIHLIKFEQDEALKLLLSHIKKFGGLEVKDKDGNTPILIACEHTRYEKIKLLHEAGADFFITNNKGNNALMILCENESYLHTGEGKDFDETCNLLLKYCPIDAKNNQGDTALILAIRSDCSPGVKWLIEKKADLELADKDGFTPLMHACSLGHHYFVEELVEAGAKIDCKANNGSTLKDLKLTIEVQRSLRKEGEKLDFIDFDK